MMYIIINSYENKRKMLRSWHVGESSPVANIDVMEIEEVQADGDELALIRRNVRNIPDYPSNVHVRYFGDTARFIVANIMAVI
jgi:hypothetical protein